MGRVASENKASLWVECLGLFFALPAFLYFFRRELAFKVVPLVLLLAVGCSIYLYKKAGFPNCAFYACGGLPRHLRNMLLALLPGAAAMFIIAWLYLPERFLTFPLARPGVWSLVMLLYPLLAAYPQEVVFRGFFFTRYEPLFPSQAAMLAANSLSFGLAHALYGNWLAPPLAALGGALFGYRYLRSGSLMAAGLEHGLWGNMLFTSGLGWYFYSGAIA